MGQRRPRRGHPQSPDALEARGRGVRLGDLKTHGKSRRDLSLPQRLVDVLRRRKAAQDAADFSPELGLVFTSSTGTPIEKTNFIRRQWQPFLKAAGVAYRPFHATRHTAASVAYAAGVPISEISKTLGHQTERTTQDVYQHTFSKILLEFRPEPED